MPTDTYFLAPPVHWCIHHGFCIFLDLKSDRYLSIPASAFEQLLASSGTGRSIPLSTALGHEMPPEVEELAESLLAGRILTAAPSKHAPGGVPHLPKPALLLSAHTDRNSLIKNLAHLPLFMRACRTADSSIRFAHIHATVSRVMARKLSRHKETTDEMRVAIFRLTQAFNSMRPLYPRPYLCLFDSLALLDFLAHWNLFPTWVFGVSADPFEAHCWVQERDVVLCDTTQFSARWFSTIMAI